MQIKTFADIERFISQNQTQYFTTPSFQSFVNDQRLKYEQNDNEHRKFIYLQTVFVVAQTVININKIWNDIPIDYYNNYFYVLKSYIPFKFSDNVAEWLRGAMTPKTFFNMIDRHSRRVGRDYVKDYKEPTFLEQYNTEPPGIVAKTSTDPVVLDNLARTEGYGIQYIVAGNVNVSPETLAYLTFEADEAPDFVRVNIARNPSTPSEIRDWIHFYLGTDDTDRNWKDTIDQLTGLLDKNVEVIPQTVQEDGTIKRWRWRLMDFHDNISFLYLKQDIVNVEFTQNTIKEPYKEGSWTVYQPKDSLDLAVWANKVRNCIRSREGNVHSGVSEIVFVEKNGNPEYTVEVSGPKERIGNSGLRLKEIQKVGKTGSTSDTEDNILPLIQRAMGIN